MGMKCDHPGCRKLKVQPHTHVYTVPIDTATVENYRIWCEIRGEPFSMPGGDGSEQSRYMINRMGKGAKDAKKFRKELSKKLDEKRKKK